MPQSGGVSVASEATPYWIFKMSFFGFFGNKVPRTAEALPEHARVDMSGNTQPISPGGDRKSVRLGQRELLYGTVRDVMIRAGVLVASYRFKVLSLDAQGRQYLIMMDLLKVDLGDMRRFGEIESMIVQAAKVRHDLVVTGVYWRNELQKPMARAPQTPSPVANSASISRAANGDPACSDLRRDSIESPKHTVTSSSPERSSKDGGVLPRKTQRSPSPEFEDTRIIAPTEYGSQLSATQYGDLE